MCHNSQQSLTGEVKPLAGSILMVKKARSQEPHALLRQLATVPDKLFAGNFAQQYGALCFRDKREASGIEILLTTSRDSGRWIIPKGWPIKGKKPIEAAATEAWEEAGIRGEVKKRPVGRFTYLKALEGRELVPCLVDVFQLRVTEEKEDFKEKGQRILEWVSPEEAARRVSEPELKTLLRGFKQRKASKPRG